MRRIDADLWVHEDELPVLGHRLGLRCTLVRLPDGVWAHSPTRLTATLRAQVDELGEVRAIVAPNNVHHLFLKEWVDAWPDAEVWVSPGVPQKTNLERYTLLDGANPWPDVFDTIYMGDVPMFNESVFFHRASRSLIVTDFIQNHPRQALPLWPTVVTELLFRPLGFRNVCLAPPLRLPWIARNRDGFDEFIRHVRELDVGRIVVTHGPLIESGARAALLALTSRFV